MEKNNFLKDYIQVNERVMRFYEKYPEGSIQTELISVDNEKVIMKALAYRHPNDIIPCNGHAEEIRNSNYINRTSAVENCETSAVGRALANLGFEIKHSIASREEIELALDKQDFINNTVMEKDKKQIFTAARKKGISTEELKSISQSITNKESSKNWSSDDLTKINEYLNSLNN